MGTDGFTKLSVSRIIYCLFLLASLPSCRPQPLLSGTKIKAKYGNYDMISWSSRYGEVRSTILAVSPNESMAFFLKVALSNLNADWSKFCWLEVWRSPGAPDYADPPDSDFSYLPRGSGPTLPLSPWSQPCPRTPVPTLECAFTFTESGDLQLSSRGLDGGETMVWSSNTSGLGATTLDLQDYDSDLQLIGFGVLLLRDASEKIVWRSSSNVHSKGAKECFRRRHNCTGLPPFEANSAARLDYLSTVLYSGVLFCGALFLPLIQ